MILLLIIVIHLILLSKLIFFPYPELFIYPYLTKIGLIPYKDILDQHFPGLMFFPINLATLGIDTPTEMRILNYGIVIINHILIFVISKKLFNAARLQILPNIFYLIWQPFLEGYVLWIDSFITPLMLLLFYFAIRFNQKKSKIDLIYLGLVFGIATLFKQVVIPIIFLYLIYLWLKYKDIKFIEYFFLGLLVPAIYLIYYVYSNGIISDFVYWTYTFNVTIFAEMGRKFGSFGEILKIFPVFGTAALISCFYLFKNPKVFFNDQIGVLSLFFVGNIIFAYARFDYVHLQPALPLAIFLIVFFLNGLKFKTKRLFFLAFLVVSLFITFRGYRGLAGSTVLFYGKDESTIAEEVRSYANSGDSIFVFGTLPHIYQMTNTVPAGRIFVFQFPWFMLRAEDRVLESMKLDRPKVILRDKTAEVAGINLTDYMADLGSYINKYYHTVNKVNDIEIMIPN